MDFNLDTTEERVLGCLLEKEMATPDYYPLSLNALTSACNQKTNREPVVSYTEETVLQALHGLKEKRLAWQSEATRVTKYAQNLDKNLNLTRREAALICLLLLRGPQTPGELRGRSDRLYAFDSIEEVTAALDNLQEMGLVSMLPRQPGRKEARFIHLLSEGTAGDTPAAGSSSITASDETRTTAERIDSLEKELEDLRQELAELRQEVQDFKNQF